MTTEPTRVALVLIGNELLSGKVSDLNGKLTVSRLRKVGAELAEIRIILDGIESIARAVRELAGRVDYVITSGGIGPTHDDITMDGIARAFEVDKEEHPELRDYIDQIFADDPTRRRVWGQMAWVPAGTELIRTADTRWPAYRVQNCFALPGVPQIFAKQLETLLPFFAGDPLDIAVLYMAVGEGRIAEPLTRATEAFPDVAFGSYPVMNNAEYRTRITVECSDPARVDEATSWLQTHLDEGSVVRVTRGEANLDA